MKLKKTILVLIAKIIAGLLPGLVSIVLNILIIKQYGSDVNGLISTMVQFTGILSIFEGGFTLSTNVALYKPLLEDDYDKVNEILSASRIVYKRIGLVALAFVIGFSIITPFYIKTDVNQSSVFFLLLISNLSLLFHFFIFAKLNVIFYAAQKEYYIEFINLFITLLIQGVSVYLIYQGIDFVVFKFITVMLILLRYPLLRYFIKKNFPKISYHSEKRDFSAIKSTTHVFLQNFAYVIFNNTDMMIISIIIGTMTASVYAIYTFIYAFIKTIVLAIVMAPFNAFGQIQTQDNDQNMIRYLNIYHFITLTITTIVLIAVNSVILPFVKLYTTGIQDINYIQPVIAIFFSIALFLEVNLSILGTLANSGARFIEMRNIAIVGALSYVILAPFLLIIFGLDGILLARITTFIVMVLLQARLVIYTMLKTSGMNFMRGILINGILLGLSIIFTLNQTLVFYSYLEFIMNGIGVFIVSLLIVVLINTLFNLSSVRDTIEFLNLKRWIKYSGRGV